jgi:hypothetical protein
MEAFKEGRTCGEVVARWKRVPRRKLGPDALLFDTSSRGGEHMTRLATRIAAALSGIIAIVLAGGAHWKS